MWTKGQSGNPAGHPSSLTGMTSRRQDMRWWLRRRLELQVAPADWDIDWCRGDRLARRMIEAADGLQGAELMRAGNDLIIAAYGARSQTDVRHTVSVVQIASNVALPALPAPSIDADIVDDMQISTGDDPPSD